MTKEPKIKMAFDFLSFAGGLAAGLIAGALGARLQQTETLATLKDRVSFALHELKKVQASTANVESASESDSMERDRLRRELAELNEEIRNMVRKRSR